MFITETQVGGCAHADKEGRFQKFSVPAGNRLKYVLNEKSGGYIHVHAFTQYTDLN